MVLGKKHGTGYLPYTCVKSHLNDKPTCCLPLRPQSRHSNLWYFGAQLLSLQPCCLRLAHYIAVIHSRLASNAVVSSLFDRISTCRIARPLLDARSGTRYSHSTPFDIIWTFVHTLLTVPDPELHCYLTPSSPLRQMTLICLFVVSKTDNSLTFSCNFIAYMLLFIIPNTLSNIWLNGIAQCFILH